MVNWVLTRFRVGIEFPYKEAGKIKRYIGSFKNSVGERKTETRKTQMSSRKGTHF